MEEKAEVKKEIIEIDRVIFKEVNDKELFVIEKIKNNNSVARFFWKMRISLIVIIAIFLIQSVGDVLKNHSIAYMYDHIGLLGDRILHYLIWMVAAFIVFNMVSLFYIFVKRQLVSLTENYYILNEAVVEDKYLGRKIAVEGKGRKKYYVTFECDQGVCSTALETDRARYIRTKVGDNIVVLKSVTVDGYTLKYLKEDEYRSIYNSKFGNS